MSALTSALNTTIGKVLIVLLLLIATVAALSHVGAQVNFSLNFSVK